MSIAPCRHRMEQQTRKSSGEPELERTSLRRRGDVVGNPIGTATWTGGYFTIRMFAQSYANFLPHSKHTT